MNILRALIQKKAFSPIEAKILMYLVKNNSLEVSKIKDLSIGKGITESITTELNISIDDLIVNSSSIMEKINNEKITRTDNNE